MKENREKGRMSFWQARVLDSILVRLASCAGLQLRQWLGKSTAFLHCWTRDANGKSQVSNCSTAKCAKCTPICESVQYAATRTASLNYVCIYTYIYIYFYI